MSVGDIQGSPDDDLERARAALIEALRRQVDERLATQGQLLIVVAAVAGAAASFGAGRLSDRPEVLALLALLFIALGLAMLRQEFEIASVEGHLLDQQAFGRDVIVQAQWEHYKATRDTSGRFGGVVLIAQSAGLFALPVIAAAACIWAALRASPGTLAYAIIAVTGILICLMGAAGSDVMARYRANGDRAAALVGAPAGSGSRMNRRTRLLSIVRRRAGAS